MCLFVGPNAHCYSAGTFVEAGQGEARVVRSGQTPERFALETPVGWLKVAPDGRSVLIANERGTRIWRWREGFGMRHFLEASNSRDVLGGGFIVVNGACVTLVSQGGALRGLLAQDSELFASNLRSPHSFAPRSFRQLPGNRVALTGSFFSDPYDVVLTVSVDELLRDPDAVQRAIPIKAPVRDRAVRVAAGPCHPDAAVVFRDPEDSEVPDDDEDVDTDEYRSDVENFAGLYIRQLDTGGLLERYEYTGGALSGAPIIATSNWIAVQVGGGVDLIRRGIGALRHVPGAILDVWGSQLAIVAGNQLVSITPIDSAV